LTPHKSTNYLTNVLFADQMRHNSKTQRTPSGERCDRDMPNNVLHTERRAAPVVKSMSFAAAR